MGLAGALVLVATVLAGAGSARAQPVVTVHGEATGPEPLPGEMLPSDGQIHVYQENMNVMHPTGFPVDMLPGDPAVDGMTGTDGLPLGRTLFVETVIDCYLVHFTASTMETASGTVRIEERGRSAASRSSTIR